MNKELLKIIASALAVFVLVTIIVVLSFYAGYGSGANRKIYIPGETIEKIHAQCAIYDITWVVINDSAQEVEIICSNEAHFYRSYNNKEVE